MRQICRDCANYCIHCEVCRNDKEYHPMNDSCQDFIPEEESEATE